VAYCSLRQCQIRTFKMLYWIDNNWNCQKWIYLIPVGKEFIWAHWIWRKKAKNWPIQICISLSGKCSPQFCFPFWLPFPSINVHKFQQIYKQYSINEFLASFLAYLIFSSSKFIFSLGAGWGKQWEGNHGGGTLCHQPSLVQSIFFTFKAENSQPQLLAVCGQEWKLQNGWMDEGPSAFVHPNKDGFPSSNIFTFSPLSDFIPPFWPFPEAKSIGQKG